MKKIILMLMVLFSFCTYAQIDSTFTEVNIRNVSGIEIKGYYKVVDEKKNKKEYEIRVGYISNLAQDLILPARTDKFIQLQLKNLSSYRFYLTGDRSEDKTKLIIKKDTFRESDAYYVKWYKDGEVPEFIVIE
jgi:hypothetical protein